MGSDIFSTKCGAHNIIVPQHRSCPVCVSAKRSQLHAANMAHMPRYLFEQTLDVQSTPQGTPVRTFMKAPEQAKPCEVSWKVNFKSNYLSQSYAKLASTTQALLMALDVTTDAHLLKMRQDYQRLIDSRATSPNDQDRLMYGLAVDTYHQIVRVSKGRIEDPERVTGQFVDYFKLLYGNGQRLIVDEPASRPAKYVLNFTSLRDSSNLNPTTQELLRRLDKYEGDVGKYRIYHEKLIAGAKGEGVKQRAVKIMAGDLWSVIALEDGHKTNYSLKVRDQFLAAVEHLYFEGQRLVEVQDPVPVTVPAIKPVRLPTYRLTLRSRDWHGHYELLQETQEAFRILEFGIPEVYQRWYALCECVAKRTTTVESMAYTMWDTVVKQHEVCELKRDMAVRQDFVARFKYLYDAGGGQQRIVIDETPAQPERKRSYADDVYDYLMMSNKTLYDCQRLVETKLGAMRPQTRASLITLFEELARDACDFYTIAKMPNYNALDTGHVYTLQTILADAYLEGKRR